MLRLEEVLTGIDVTRTIAQAVAPAILVSAGGLMLLGLQNKFHNIVDRIRQLDREIMDYERQGPPDEIRRQRLRAAEAQVDILLLRCGLTRDAIFLLYIAVLFLVGATLTAALGGARTPRPGLDHFPLVRGRRGGPFPVQRPKHTRGPPVVPRHRRRGRQRARGQPVAGPASAGKGRPDRVGRAARRSAFPRRRSFASASRAAVLP